jgi:hypothetical protein
MKRQFKLINQDTKVYVCRQVMQAEFGKVVIVQDPTRTLEANAKLHAMLSDIAKQAKYMGKARTVDFWKALFVSGWMVATKQQTENCPGLEGEYFILRESTATMSGKKLASVIEYISAWAAQEGIRFTAAEWEFA